MDGDTTGPRHDLSLELDPLGKTAVTPVTTYYWHQDRQATVEITDLTESVRMVRASKTCRLEKLDAEQQENWDANIRELNDYLAAHFPRFQLLTAYSNETTPEVTGIADEVADLHDQYTDLTANRQQAQAELDGLSHAASVDTSSDTVADTLTARRQGKKQQLENVEAQLDRLAQQLAKTKREHGEWRRKGVSLAYLFTFSTRPEITGRDLDTAIQDKLRTITERFENAVRKPLQGENFKFALSEVSEPRVLNRVEHTTVLDPYTYNQLLDEHPELKDVLLQLREQALAQYEAYATQDLMVDGTTVERSKATPGQAVNAVIQELEAANVARTRSAPNDGPMVGTLAGTRQVVGFDPTEYFEHLYLAGKTGSGKSYLKRVLIENAAACGAHVLTITPTDTQSLGVAFPYTGGGDLPLDVSGQALRAECYWPGHDQLLDLPNDSTDLLTEVTALTCKNLDAEQTNEVLADLLAAVYEAEFPADEPLVLGLDEAQVLTGEAKDLLMKIVKEKRKDNVHVVVATQSPMEFKRQYSDIRENTATVFLRGEYFSYAEDFTHILDSTQEVADLDRGQAILHSMDLDRVTVDVRPPVSQVEKLRDDQLEELKERYTPEHVDFPKSSRSWNSKSRKKAKEAKTVQSNSIADGNGSGGEEPGSAATEVELSELEADLLDWMHDFLAAEEYEFVTARNCWSPDGAPCTSRTAGATLDKLVEKGVVEQADITRAGNQTTGYRPTATEARQA